MDSVPKKTIWHFSHPGHRLVELNAGTEYLCDGCKTRGRGCRYRCDECNFDLHDHCGTNCPPILYSFMHPHPLTLFTLSMPHGTLQNVCICDVCLDPVEGMFYWCKDCNFTVHPICTQLQSQLSHALDPVHPLKLQTSISSSRCAVCGGACSSWRYGCSSCGVDIHLECILTPCVPTTQRSIPPPQWGPTPPPPYPLQPPPPLPPLYGDYYGAPQWGPTPPPPPPLLYPLQPPPPLPPLYGDYYGAPQWGPTPPPPPPLYPLQPPPPLPPMYGAPDGYISHNHNMYNYGNQQAQGGGGWIGGKMFQLVGSLAVGVLSNTIFGLIQSAFN